MLMVVLRGTNLEITLGMVILIESPLKSSPNDKMLPSKRGEIYLLELVHKY